jgi:hypothetical protein
MTSHRWMLLLSFVLVVSLSHAQDFRKMYWGDSVAKVKNVEGSDCSRRNAKDYYLDLGLGIKGTDVILTYRRLFGSNTATLEYGFQKDRLVCAIWTVKYDVAPELLTSIRTKFGSPSQETTPSRELTASSGLIRESIWMLEGKIIVFKLSIPVSEALFSEREWYEKQRTEEEKSKADAF